MSDERAAMGRIGYADAYAQFKIASESAALHGDLDKAINACVECCDRHCGENRLALRCVSADGRVQEYSYDQLRDLSARAANLFRDKGVAAGDVIAGLLPRGIELVATILGTWRLGAVYQPMFTAFGPKAIEQRLETSRARLIVTDLANRPKLDGLPGCPQVATVAEPGQAIAAGDVDFRAGLADASDSFEPVMRRGDDLFMLMSTSGTTGAPKGVPVSHRALLAFAAYMRDAIDLRQEDVFWNIADAGWAYGLYYAITGPLMLGCATTLYAGSFTAQSTYELIARLGVTNFAGSPTAYRALIAAGPELAAPVKGQIRAISSAGEPLNPEVIRWMRDHLDAPIHDHYGQTEMGMCVNNHHRLDHPVRAGSAGFAMPGYRVAVLDDEDRELGPNQPGVLAIDLKNSPLMWFSGYYKKDTPAIANGYYRTGDTVELEEDGSVSFIGRSDDVITSSGYRIGPFDVESALLEHPAVIEAAVVGVPDPERTELVKAFVILARDVQPSDALREELQQYVKVQLAAHAYPRLLDFVTELPKTPSGKIQRFLLRKAETERAAGERG